MRRPLVAWLKRTVGSRHPCLSAQAALSLAQRRQLSESLAARAYERAPEVHRPTVALAVSAAHASRANSFEAEDQLEGWLADWISTQPWGRPRATIKRRQSTS